MNKREKDLNKKEILNKEELFMELKHEYDSKRGLWCIDRDPQDVSIDFIRRNCFQLE